MITYKTLNYVVNKMYKLKPSTERIRTITHVYKDTHDSIEKMVIDIFEDNKKVIEITIDTNKREYMLKTMKKTFEYPFTKDYITRLKKELDYFFRNKTKRKERKKIN